MNRLPRATRRLACAAMACAALLADCATEPRERRADDLPPIIHAEPMPDWDAAFQKSNPAWRGADADISIPLAQGRALWLFGDSWIAPAGAAGREGARLIRNSLAIQPFSKKGDASIPGAPDFFWRMAHDGGGADAFRSEREGLWLWPLSGLRDGERLFLFMSELEKSEGGLGFASAGNAMLAIDNWEDHPNLWRPVREEIPFFRRGKTGDQVFGLASLLEGGDAYIYGTRENWLKGMNGREVILARAPAEALSRGDFSAWRFFSEEGWSADPAAAKALFDGAAAEMSVSFLPSMRKYAAVYTERGLSERILARLAPRPEGPWEPPVLLYEVPDVQWSPNYFSYAGKAHPELAARGDELIVTYAVNSKDFGDHARDARLYWPRFVRARIAPDPRTLLARRN